MASKGFSRLIVRTEQNRTGRVLFREKCGPRQLSPAEGRVNDSATFCRKSVKSALSYKKMYYFCSNETAVSETIVSEHAKQNG